MYIEGSEENNDSIFVKYDMYIRIRPYYSLKAKSRNNFPSKQSKLQYQLVIYFKLNARNTSD